MSLGGFGIVPRRQTSLSTTETRDTVRPWEPHSVSVAIESGECTDVSADTRQLVVVQPGSPETERLPDGKPVPGFPSCLAYGNSKCILEQIDGYTTLVSPKCVAAREYRCGRAGAFASTPARARLLGQQLQWEALDSWLTPNNKFFTVAHYDKPVLD